MISISRNTTPRLAAALLAALLFSACGAQSGDSIADGTRGDSEPPVTLSFAWPDGLTAKVRTTAVKSQSLGGQSRVQDMVSTYRMHVRYGGDEIAVAFEDFQVERSGSPKSAPAVERVLAYRPGFTVDSKGELAKVVGLETLRELMPPLQQYIESAAENERAGLELMAKTVTSEQYLKARAGSEWNNLIGSWKGETLVPGKTVETVVDSEPSGFVDKPLKTTVRVSLTKIGPCMRGESRQCVRLWMTREPDQQALKEAMRPNLGKMLGVDDWGPSGPPKLHSVIATSKLIVDAEPDTLVPHRVETLRVFSLEIERPDGVLEVRDSNRTTSEYLY